MKMADNSLLTFQNNCESINRNGVEVKPNRIKDNNTNDSITALQIIINKPDDQPQSDILQNSSDILSQEDVVDEFLAGQNKSEYNNDLLLLSNIDNDNEGISFKSENTISECNNGEMEKTDFPLLDEMENSGPLLRRISTAGFIANKLKRRSIKCNYYGKTRGNSKVIYHIFPSTPDLAAKWMKACGNKKDAKPPPYARVCSDHFSSNCYQRDLQHELLGLPLRKKLFADAVPDQNLPVKPPGKTKIGILKNNVDVQLAKNNNKVNRLPMRSSIRIAKKKSIESLSDSFTAKVNSIVQRDSKPGTFSDKYKFLAKLQLRHQPKENYLLNERNENLAPRAACDVDSFFKIMNSKEGRISPIESLNKMQIMEDVREGCNVQPSSPGHAEQRSDNDTQVKTETLTENGYGEQNSNNENHEENSEDQKEDIKPSESEGEVAESTKNDFPDANNLNDESYSNTSSPSAESSKRKSDNEDFPIKRLRTEIQDNFVSRDKILNEYIEMADCNNLEQIQAFSEQLLIEIKACNELAREKEREWNSIIHLKKIKEELLLRMQRKRQVMLVSEKSDYSDLPGESQSENSDDRLSGSPHSILKTNLTHPQKSGLRIPNFNMKGDKSKHRNILPKLPQTTMELNGSLDLRQGKQRPVLDVQSIIADYRQRHPEAVPRRGRRIRNSQSDSSNRSSILNISSMALGSGSQVKQNLHGIDMSNELGLLLSSMNGNRTDLSKSTSGDSAAYTMHDTTSFKDMLVQFARLSQSERNELIQNAIKPPPPYPEVTVHPVPTTTAAPTNSLLHGILTKSPPKQNNKTSFSPTLARLLTAPERAASNQATSTPTMTNSTTIHPANMSISEILSTSKARNEITITPVGTQYESTPNKGRSTEEEEAEDSADRLVIDESSEAVEARRAADNSSEAGDDVPPCQGCNQRSAQFVCAGCGNQWYCSRDCQVSAWDEHSEVCSG